ncbi:uncharacterized protein LOC123308997 [Coccinella septempunctata]|uniref:uncharacterized protein LOC123308997 n=1 Tax=Coccinella septempunctata TaxID=41139 RepID=UPI001D07A978|nr:uncharacterized protein LOC123308997 [Coccinella septempunctata]
METSRKNKRTYCSPKLRDLNGGCDQDDQAYSPSNSPSNTKQNSNSTNSPVVPKHNRNPPARNNRKQINYKIQNYAKILSEIPEKISREKNQDHLVFSTANTQIFQAKVTYFPGKNLNDLRRALTSNKFDEGGNDKSRSERKINTPEKTFGKHLICPKKKSKKMKIVQKPLNTIAEVNENDRSKESLMKAAQKKEEPKENSSSINMSYTDVSENYKQATVVTVDKEKNDFNTIKPEYKQKECVSYLFEEDKSVFKPNFEEYQSSEKSSLPSVDAEEDNIKHVFQIRDMFEKMSKNEIVPEKKRELKHPTISFDPLHFEHTISCEECRRILKDLIDTENISKKDMKLAMSEIPSNSARRIVDSLVQEICERSLNNKSDISFKIETKNTTTISKFSYRRSRRRTRRKGMDEHDMQLNEKKH